MPQKYGFDHDFSRKHGMSQPYGPGSVTMQASRGLWKASFQGQSVTYSESRIGDMAEELAHWALQRLQAGDFDPVADDLQFKQSWRIEDAAKQLGMSVSQLRQHQAIIVCDTSNSGWRSW